MKNKTKKALCAISILGVVAISGIFAYLTDNESKENVFTIGNVDIELLEPSWPTEDLHGDAENDDGPNGIPDAVENLVPNQFVAKDPQVKNVGKNDAYVFLRVQYKMCGDSLTYLPVPNVVPWPDNELEKNLGSRGWLVSENNMDITVDNDGNIYASMVYAYKDVLEPGQTTSALFDGIEIRDLTEAYRGLKECIKIDAFAIQANELPADIAEEIAEAAEGIEEIDYNNFGDEDVEALNAYGNAMGAVYDIIMNQNPNAQTTSYVPAP